MTVSAWPGGSLRTAAKKVRAGGCVEGLSLRLAPSYGDAGSGLARLWEEGVAGSGVTGAGTATGTTGANETGTGAATDDASASKANPRSARLDAEMGWATAWRRSRGR